MSCLAAVFGRKRCWGSRCTRSPAEEQEEGQARQHHRRVQVQQHLALALLAYVTSCQAHMHAADRTSTFCHQHHRHQSMLAGLPKASSFAVLSWSREACACGPLCTAKALALHLVPCACGQSCFSGKICLEPAHIRLPRITHSIDPQQQIQYYPAACRGGLCGTARVKHLSIGIVCRKLAMLVKHGFWHWMWSFE